MGKIFRKTSIVAIVLGMAVLLFAGCSGDSGTAAEENADAAGNSGADQSAAADKTIRIGSKTFTEGFILSELYALALEKSGYDVERVYNISDVNLAIQEDQIDLYPEYTGTGLVAVLKEAPLYDAQEVYDKVKRDYLDKFDIVWLKQADINDSQGLFISKKASEAFGIKTISDLQANAGKIRFASQGGFDEREDGIPALEAVYGPLDFKSHNVYDDSLKYDIVGNDEADVGVAYTTEGNLVSPDFIVLEDDRHVWPPYYVAPIVRNEYLKAHPDIEAVLNAVSDELNNEVIIALNAEVDIDKEEYTDVTREWFSKTFE
ncbi:MAG: glycine/betaine ABC transporter substrate-binding protein [Clostridiales Family XIII bacterium]|nr:glycine/betaine ABC transporter substrate-binding protein [Clostridiales Family XIII bacterium]